VKRFLCILAFLVLALPAWPAKKITVGELEDMLKTMQADKKSDADVATALKQVDLSEQLTRSKMNDLAAFAPGPLTTEQFYILEARSAFLPPPSSDIPANPAPDSAAQKAILDKASAYIAKIFDQLPETTATKTTLRFQDNVEAAAASSGLHSSSTDNSTGSSFSDPYRFVHYINSTESEYSSLHGMEKLAEDKTRWGSNGMIALEEPAPDLSEVFQDAELAGGITWLRWETVNGKPAAVFSFETQKKKTHFNVNICCFPEVAQAGVMHFTSSSMAGAGAPGATAGGAHGNFQTATAWQNFKAGGVPYHGEFFIDPDTGIVVRMNTQAEFKPGEVVHEEDTRVDYGPLQAGKYVVVLPMRSIILTEVAPNGDSQSAGTYTTRRTFFTIEYKNYQGDFAAVAATLNAIVPPARPQVPEVRNEEKLVNKKDTERLNSILMDARKANAEKRYTDAEALILPITQSNPGLILPWVELGLAQLALKKYPDAENDFKMALGIDPAVIRKMHQDAFYNTDTGPDVVAPFATRSSRNGAGGEVVNSGENRSADIKGSCFASLGEIYAHEGKVKEAKDAFDSAVEAYPSQAAQYRHNEMLVFFETGQVDEQLAAAIQAIALDSSRADSYYFKAQALATKATIDPKTQKMVLPPGCLEAYRKYLQLAPKGPYSADAQSIVAAAR